MVDVHSHLLPMVDDGSASIRASLEILKELSENGVTDVILTPHYKGKFKKPIQELKERFLEFNERKKEQGININLHLGSEIHYSYSNVKNLIDGKVLTLNNTRYVLIELGHKPKDALGITKELLFNGFVPIFAHVERYTYLSKKELKIVKSIGALIQIDARSLVKKHYKYKRRTKRLIKNGLVDFVASDMHLSRTNYFIDAYNYAKKKFGNETAEKLFVLNAKKIISNA